MFQTGKYQEYTEFHADMMLVKSNCLRYNPPEHEIHQVSSIDCHFCQSFPSFFVMDFFLQISDHKRHTQMMNVLQNYAGKWNTTLQNEEQHQTVSRA